MSKAVKIRRGLNIPIPGEADKVQETASHSDVHAIKPTDFPGLMPKLVLKEGAKVKCGTTVFFDKYNEQVKYASPVAGEIVEIVRGAKRRILEIKILAEKETTFEDFGSADPSQLSREEVIAKICEAGAWPFIKMRPLDVVADPKDQPKAIFVSVFDSAPLAPDYSFILEGNQEAFRTGLEALAKLTEGKVHMGTGGENSQGFAAFQDMVEVTKYYGPHPSGNVGVQIHHTDPINKGEVVWTINPQDLILIGKLFLTGHYDSEKLVALTGSRAEDRKYYRTRMGAQLKTITGETVEDVRYVSGNVLTGDNVGADGYLGFYHSQITCLPEGNKHKFFLTEGWLSPGLSLFGLTADKFSKSMAYPAQQLAKLFPDKKYDIDTNLNGEERAFVVTGQYEEVFPFDIYPVYLLKAIITNDIDGMEKLGIYEVAPEDFALCEFVCTSKINAQKIVREGLEVVQKECM